jgi:putative Mg2+ transporter-C (MgtC) family protein
LERWRAWVNTTLSLIGAAGVLLANLVLRPLIQKIDLVPVEAAEEVVLYLLECVCRVPDEGKIRTLLVQDLGRTALLLYGLKSEDEEGTNRVRVTAHVKSTGRKDDLLEQIVTRLSLERGVTEIRWQIASALDAALGGNGGPAIDEDSKE